MPSTTQTLDIAALAALFPASSAYAKDFGWVAIAGPVILGFGQEPMIEQLGEAILKETGDSEKSQLSAFRKLREALLKASPLVGFPRSINGLSTLRSFLESRLPAIASALESDKSLRDPISLEQRQTRGKEFFSRIYAQHTEKVLNNLNVSSGGDLGEFAINCIYGDLVAETSVLSAKETGLLEFVCCMTLAAAPQAKGHMYGAHNLGNNAAEIEAATKLVEKIAKDLQAPWSDEGMDFLSKPKEKGW